MLLTCGIVEFADYAHAVTIGFMAVVRAIRRLLPEHDSRRFGQCRNASLCYSGQQALTHMLSVVRFHVGVRPVMYGSSSLSNRKMSVS